MKQCDPNLLLSPGSSLLGNGSRCGHNNILMPGQRFSIAALGKPTQRLSSQSCFFYLAQNTHSDDKTFHLLEKSLKSVAFVACFYTKKMLSAFLGSFCFLIFKGSWNKALRNRDLDLADVR